MDPTTKRRLREAKDTMDRDKLEDVLKHCEKEGYLTQLVRDVEMFENITDAEAALAVATSQLKEDFLVKALQMCDDFGYNVQVVQNARPY